MRPLPYGPRRPLMKINKKICITAAKTGFLLPFYSENRSTPIALFANLVVLVGAVQSLMCRGGFKWPTSLNPPLLMWLVVGGNMVESFAGQHEGDGATRDARSGRVVRGETARGLGVRAARPGRTLCRTDLVDRRDQPRLSPTRRRLRKFSQGLQQETGTCVLSMPLAYCI